MNRLSKNKPQLHCLRMIKKIKNYTNESQDNLIESEIFKIEIFKDYKIYISSNEDEKLQYNLVKFIANKIRDDEYSMNILSLGSFF